jgi:hypothetical protein
VIAGLENPSFGNAVFQAKPFSSDHLTGADFAGECPHICGPR